MVPSIQLHTRVVRFDDLTVVSARCACAGDITKDSGCDAGQQSRAVCRAILDVAPVDRSAENVSLQLSQELAPPAAPGCAYLLNSHT